MKNVIFEGLFGSRLYGLETLDSDTDYKGVYLPTKREIIFNQYKDTIETKVDDVDRTWIALPKFIKIASKCDTVTFDMLHTPLDKTIENSHLWEMLKSHRSDLYSKGMRGILGYIRTQTTKYGHKVQRYQEMKELQVLLGSAAGDTKIENTEIPAIVDRLGFKYITVQFFDEGDVRANINVCGSRYQLNAQIGYLKQGLRTKIAKYGKRTEKGSLSGGDWKSLSHAMRALFQLEEIIDTRNLVFPLKKREEILKVKLGQYPQDKVITMITDLYDTTFEKLNNSDLPEHPVITNMEDCVMNYLEYLGDY